MRPSSLTVRSAPLMKERMVLLPTPVSPMTRTADSEVLSTGMAWMPLRIIYLSRARSIGAFSINSNYNIFSL